MTCKFDSSDTTTPSSSNAFPSNWKTFDERTFDFCQGITLHHLPGHTDGLIGMQINLRDSGTFLFISDHCHVIENWRDGIPQGWLARDHPAWV